MGPPPFRPQLLGRQGPKRGLSLSGAEESRHRDGYQERLGLVRRGRASRGWARPCPCGGEGEGWRGCPSGLRWGRGWCGSVSSGQPLVTGEWWTVQTRPSLPLLCLLPLATVHPSPGRQIFLTPRFRHLRSSPPRYTAPDMAGAP